MRALTHHTDVAEPPVGIWWEDESGDGVRSFYLTGYEAEHTIARQVMSQKLPDVSWASYFDALEDAAPFVNGWEGVEVFEAPDVFLDRMARIPA